MRARARATASSPASARTATGRPRVGASMPVSSWRSRVSAASANQRTKRILILLSILAFLVAVSGSTVAGYVNQRSEIAAMREQVREQQRRVAQLHADMLRWQDPAYVEQQARERLKFVRVGERSYTVIDAQPPRTVTEVSVDMAAPTSQLPWYATVWESARVADAGVAAPGPAPAP
ncbi:MAG: septum formation initiator family protein [Tetrasphaera sp.]|nr:septum formation initiator family protein [Tetrasphaera sp.]